MPADLTMDTRPRLIMEPVAIRLGHVFQHCIESAVGLAVGAVGPRADVLGEDGTIPAEWGRTELAPANLAAQLAHAWVTFVMAGFPRDDSCSVFLLATQYTRRLFEAGVACEAQVDLHAVVVSVFTSCLCIACKYCLDHSPTTKWIYSAVYGVQGMVPSNTTAREYAVLQRLDFRLGDMLA